MEGVLASFAQFDIDQMAERTEVAEGRPVAGVLRQIDAAGIRGSAVSFFPLTPSHHTRDFTRSLR